MSAGLVHFPGADERAQAVTKAGVWFAAAALGLLLPASSELQYPGNCPTTTFYVYII